MQSEQLKSLIDTVAQTVIAHAQELTLFDQAIGDGDHGLNMKRGFERLMQLSSVIAKQELSHALTEIGKTLVMTVGGAAGPLYGTFFMTFGRELSAQPSNADIGAAFQVALAAVERRGKSSVGQKTLLDVLFPVCQELRSGHDDVLGRVKRRAALAAQATTPMLALRGRAAFLGQRSIGHMDPGAYSAALIVTAVCDFLGA